MVETVLQWGVLGSAVGLGAARLLCHSAALQLSEFERRADGRVSDPSHGRPESSLRARRAIHEKPVRYYSS